MIKNGFSPNVVRNYTAVLANVRKQLPGLYIQLYLDIPERTYDAVEATFKTNYPLLCLRFDYRLVSDNPKYLQEEQWLKATNDRITYCIVDAYIKTGCIMQYDHKAYASKTDVENTSWTLNAAGEERYKKEVEFYHKMKMMNLYN